MSNHGIDVCVSTEAAHATESFLKEALDGSKAPNYLMQGPAIHIDKKLKEEAKEISLPVLPGDGDPTSAPKDT